MNPRKQELAEWSETALRQLRGPVAAGVRKRIAQWRDPRARLLRRRRRAKQTTVAGATATGLLGAGSVVPFAPHVVGIPVAPGVLETMLDVGAFGLAGVALAAGAGTVGEAVKYRRLRRTPLPEPPPEPVELPPHGSRAHEPMRRLAEAEASLHGVLTQLSEAGAGEAAAEARATANTVAAALRQVAGRLVAVEAAARHAPAADADEFRDHVARLRAELDEGVAEYGRLIAAAGRAVAASDAPEQKHLMQDATDRLAGLAVALQELSGPRSPGSEPIPPGGTAG